MAVDNKKVCEIIKEKIDRSTGASRPARIAYAFDMISNDRENYYKGDPNYAAAEHYLYARYIVGYTHLFGLILITAANFGYQVVKKIVDALGEEEKLRFGKGPVTPASVEDFLWAERGGKDGLDDSFITEGISAMGFNFRSNKPDYPPACK